MLKISIVTPESKILTDADIEEITIPTTSGEIGILEGHTALMTMLQPGTIQYRLANTTETKSVVVSWGYCEVQNKTINILAETAERPEDVDVQRAETALKKAEDKLLDPNLDPSQIEKYLWKKERAAVRLAVSKLMH